MPSPEQKMREAAENIVIKLLNYDNMDFNEAEQAEHDERVNAVLSALQSPGCLKAPISSAPDGAGTPETRLAHTLQTLANNPMPGVSLSEWGSFVNRVLGLEQQRDALKRDLGMAQARIKELEAK